MFSATSFCFLVPLVLDPAISSLHHQFVRSTCSTTRGRYRQGKQNCDWTSCREGCTHEVYNCWQIEVEYNIYDQNSSIIANATGRCWVPWRNDSVPWNGSFPSASAGSW